MLLCYQIEQGEKNSHFFFPVKIYPLNALVLMNKNSNNNTKTTSAVITMSAYFVQESCTSMFYIHFSLILTKPYEADVIIFLMRKLRLKATGI